MASSVEPVGVEVRTVLLENLNDSFHQIMLHIFVKLGCCVKVGFKFRPSDKLSVEDICDIQNDLVDLIEYNERSKVRFF